MNFSVSHSCGLTQETIDPNLVKEHLGVYSVRRFMQNDSQLSTSASLSIQLQDALTSCAPVRQLPLACDLLQSDDNGNAQITED